jgi:hypothetical protein
MTGPKAPPLPEALVAFRHRVATLRLGPALDLPGEERSRALHSGWLWEADASGAAWRRRFCVLLPGAALACYADEAMSSTGCASVASLPQVHIYAAHCSTVGPLPPMMSTVVDDNGSAPTTVVRG